MRECLAAKLVTDVVVSTDDQAIAAAARQAGAEVVLRPAAIAGDTATSEAAVLHAMDAHETLHGTKVDVVLLVQCTSPFIIREDVDGVVNAVVHNGADSALTVAPFHGFIWRDAADDPQAAPGERTAVEAGTGCMATETVTVGGGYGVNHDKSFRPRRQDRPQDLLETGAVYAMDATGFRQSKHRFFGHTEPVAPTRPACWRSTTRTTSPAPGPSRRSSTRTAPSAPSPTADDIDAVVLDFDGTQTDDRVLIDSEGRSSSPCIAVTASESQRCARAASSC